MPNVLLMQRLTQPTVVEQRDATSSQEASLHSQRSQGHLAVPETVHSPESSSSAPSSQHTQDGSASSRPSARSHVRDASSAQSSSGESGNEVGVLRSPPLSAIMGSFGSMQASRQPSRTSARLSALPPPPGYVTSSSSRVPLLGGTMGSSRSTNTDTNSSVTTAVTDPISGAILHFPSLPFVRGDMPQTIRRVERQHDDDNSEPHW
jgi:hypothetical protein